MPFLQTTNPFPETSHNASRASIRQSRPTMHDTNSHLPGLPPIVIREVKPSQCQILTSPPVQSNAVPGKQRAKQWRLMPGRWVLCAVPSHRWPSAPPLHTHTHPIYRLTRSHLSLSSYSDRKYADLKPWHFVTGTLRWPRAGCEQTRAFEGASSKMRMRVWK